MGSRMSLFAGLAARADPPRQSTVSAQATAVRAATTKHGSAPPGQPEARVPPAWTPPRACAVLPKGGYGALSKDGGLGRAAAPSPAVSIRRRRGRLPAGAPWGDYRSDPRCSG